MKKLISLVLSFFLLCTALSAVFVFDGLAAKTDFENEDSWIVNKDSSTNIEARSGTQENGELLYDGGFDRTTAVQKAESYDTVTYESAHIWYMPSSASSIVSEGENKVLRLASWAYQSVKIEANAVYHLTFKAKTSGENIAVTPTLRNLRNRAQILTGAAPIPIQSNGEWAEYTATISVAGFLDSVSDYTLGLHAGTATPCF